MCVRVLTVSRDQPTAKLSTRVSNEDNSCQAAFPVRRDVESIPLARTRSIHLLSDAQSVRVYTRPSPARDRLCAVVHVVIELEDLLLRDPRARGDGEAALAVKLVRRLVRRDAALLLLFLNRLQLQTGCPPQRCRLARPWPALPPAPPPAPPQAPPPVTRVLPRATVRV